MKNLPIAMRVLMATALLWPVNILAQQETVKPARGSEEQSRVRLTPAERANMPFALMRRAADALQTAGLLSERQATDGQVAPLPRRSRSHEVN